MIFKTPVFNNISYALLFWVCGARVEKNTCIQKMFPSLWCRKNFSQMVEYLNVLVVLGTCIYSQYQEDYL